MWMKRDSSGTWTRTRTNRVKVYWAANYPMPDSAASNIDEATLPRYRATRRRSCAYGRKWNAYLLGLTPMEE